VYRDGNFVLNFVLRRNSATLLGIVVRLSDQTRPKDPLISMPWPLREGRPFSFDRQPGRGFMGFDGPPVFRNSSMIAR
jgi:hypothetical protein